MNLKETHSSYKNVKINEMSPVHNEVQNAMIMVTELVIAIFDHDVK